MQNKTQKLNQLSKHKNRPGVEAWFQWELMLDPLFYTKWEISKRRDYDLELVDKLGQMGSINIELKSVTGHDFNNIVKKWYNAKGKKERRNIPILFLALSHQQKQVQAMKNDPGFICDYDYLGSDWIIGICKPI